MQPASASSEVLIAPFNDLETTAAILEEHADEIAGVVCEPFQRIVSRAMIAGIWVAFSP